jgi:hypothetical protein
MVIGTPAFLGRARWFPELRTRGHVNIKIGEHLKNIKGHLGARIVLVPAHG